MTRQCHISHHALATHAHCQKQKTTANHCNFWEIISREFPESCLSYRHQSRMQADNLIIIHITSYLAANNLTENPNENRRCNNIDAITSLENLSLSRESYLHDNPTCVIHRKGAATHSFHKAKKVLPKGGNDQTPF